MTTIDTNTPVTPIFNQDTRCALYDLVLALCEDAQSCGAIVDATLHALNNADLPHGHSFPGRESFVRANCGYVGLANLGQTCYMNSLLQQLYMNTTFRKFILGVSIDDPSKQAVLVAFQDTFAYLQGSFKIDYNPHALAQVLDVDVCSQEDAHIFFTTLIGKLEDSMPNEETKKALRAFFGGRNRSQTRGDCGHVSEATDDYFNLSLVVKDKAGLLESLQEYVEGAQLEGGEHMSFAQ